LGHRAFTQVLICSLKTSWAILPIKLLPTDDGQEYTAKLIKLRVGGESTPEDFRGVNEASLQKIDDLNTKLLQLRPDSRTAELFLHFAQPSSAAMEDPAMGKSYAALGVRSSRHLGYPSIAVLWGWVGIVGKRALEIRRTNACCLMLPLVSSERATPLAGVAAQPLSSHCCSPRRRDGLLRADRLSCRRHNHFLRCICRQCCCEPSVIQHQNPITTAQ